MNCFQMKTNLSEKLLQNNRSFCIEGSPSRNLGFWKDYVGRLALENVLDILDDTIGQRHDGQVVGVIPKGILDF